MMHKDWFFIPKRLLVSTKTHVAICNRTREAICGAGMPNAKRGFSAVLPFVYELVDCLKCRGYLALNPRNMKHMKWMPCYANHPEIPSKWDKHGKRCTPKSLDDVTFFNYMRNSDYMSMSWVCVLDGKTRHSMSLHHDWTEPHKYGYWW